MEHVPGAFEAQSMNFGGSKAKKGNSGGLNTQKVFGGTGSIKTSAYAASLGPLGESGDTKNVFKRINLYHIHNYGSHMNTYRFFNPKILSLELDELDMTDSGAGSEMSFQFAYDTVNVATDVNIQINGEHVSPLTNLGDHPWDPNFGAETATKLPGEGNPDTDGGGFFSGLGEVAGGITGSISGFIDAGTGLVSDAFDAASNFAGSTFDDFTSGAAKRSAKSRSAIANFTNDAQSSGDIGTDN